MSTLPLFFAIFCLVVAENRSTNSTRPPSSAKFSDHGDANIVCRPAKWTDILIFFVGNYLAHAATTKTMPGQSPLTSCRVILAALLFPTSGVFRGFGAIRTRAIFAETELQMAARAGALCMIIKDKRCISPEDVHADGGGRGRIQLRSRRPGFRLLSSKIHGCLSLPSGWCLMIVPPNAKFETDEPGPEGIWAKLAHIFERDTQNARRISSNYNFVKAAVVLGQTVFGAVTLYRTKGDQISRFGYAAFGLTVVPYCFMSLVNLAGNLVCPEYPAIYLIENQELQCLREIISSQGSEDEFYVEGTVGKLTAESERCILDARQEDTINTTRMLSADGRLVETMAATLRLYRNSLYLATKLNLSVALAAAVPLAVIGVISRFQVGSSSHAERAWTMTWLVFGITTGAIGTDAGFFERWIEKGSFLQMEEKMPFTPLANRGANLWIIAITLLIYSAPAIGGFVIVVQMIQAYGVCVRLS